MRSHQTDAEQRLWYHLRAGRFMGLKFKRQKPVGPFIADFVCLELGLIVEADGGQHGDVRDLERDASLRSRGFTVLHFWNNEVLQETESVLERIRAVALTLSPDPSPARGRGEKDGWPSPACGRGEKGGWPAPACERGEKDGTAGG